VPWLRCASLLLILALTACGHPTGPEWCRIRVAQLPGETTADAIRRTVPEALRKTCGEDLIIDLVYVNG